MVAPKETVWRLEPHTLAKHEILKRYLEAWTAILGSGVFGEVVYVDGFAGPGKYENAEDGSPVIALKAALRHQGRCSATLRFVFVERDPSRAQHLQEVVCSIQLPPNYRVKVVPGSTFQEVASGLLNHYDNRPRPVPPTFAFIDPFGWTGIPFELIRRLLSFPHCEILVNLMYEDVNRFLAHPNQTENFEHLFGSPRWRKIVPIREKLERKAAIRGLYRDQLRTAAKYVRSFEMRNRNNVTDYFLFFATNNLRGLEKMKEAMWNADNSGEFTFSDATNPAQTLLFAPTPDRTKLERQIVRRFQGQGPSVRELETYVLEETPFLKTHYKQVLRGLEERGALHVPHPPEGRRLGTFAHPEMRIEIRG